VAMAQMADKWENLKGYDKLEYRTVKDNRVRESHAKLDGLVLDTNDKLWSTLWPPNDWGCRCNVVPAPGATVDGDKRKVADEFSKSDAIKPYFKRNSGIEKTVFNDKHPYFTRLKSSPLGSIREQQFLAEENYGMRPAESLVTGKKPVLPIIDEKDKAKQEFESSKKELNTADGINFNISNRWNHIVNDNNEDRWKYINSFSDVLENADEVWSTKEKDKIFKRYVKYYNGQPVVVSFPIDTPEEWTIYKSDLEDGKFKRLRKDVRRGVLIHRK
jgi:hypothetical protein